MLIDIDIPETENINDIINKHYLSESVPSINKQGEKWGVYQFKPTSQTIWEQSVKQTASEICSVQKATKMDLRPRLMDQNSGLSILLDTGTCASIWPRRYFKNLTPDPHKKLQAVNGARIDTYGEETIEIHPQHAKFPYRQKVIIANVDQPILGFNFILTYKLDLQWSKGKCKLVDNIRNQIMPLKMDVYDQETIGLSLVSFRQYSQAKSEQNSKQEPKKVIPPAYKEIVDQYPGVLKVNFIDTPLHGVKHDIKTGSNRPCKATVRKMVPGSEKAIKTEKAWKQLERIGVVEKVPAGEPTVWSSPLHIAVKADGSLRPVGDYRALNSLTEADNYPLPNLKDFGPQIKNCKFFSKIDLLKAYYNVELTQEAMSKTTVLTSMGVYRFRRLPMGLKNSAASFQRLMSTILSGLSNVFVYLDDVLVFDNNESEHKKSIAEVFRRLAENGLSINLKKCQFGKKQLNFLGYRVDGNGIVPLPRKLQAIADFPAPQKPKQLLGFLGAVNYYRRSLPKIEDQLPATILHPLYQWATKKTPGRKFVDVWKEENLQHYFDLAKRMIMMATQLVHPDPACPLAMRTDSSNYAMGGCLEQFTNNKWEPIGFWSKSLKPSEATWSTYRRELYAVQQCVRHFISEIDGRKLTVYTDHRPIIHSFYNQDSMKHDPIARNQLLEISNWVSEIKHISGACNPVADTMSRPPRVDLGQEGPECPIQAQKMSCSTMEIRRCMLRRAP